MKQKDITKFKYFTIGIINIPIICLNYLIIHGMTYKLQIVLEIKMKK